MKSREIKLMEGFPDYNRNNFLPLFFAPVGLSETRTVVLQSNLFSTDLLIFITFLPEGRFT